MYNWISKKASLLYKNTIQSSSGESPHERKASFYFYFDKEKSRLERTLISSDQTIKIFNFNLIQILPLYLLVVECPSEIYWIVPTPHNLLTMKYVGLTNISSNKRQFFFIDLRFPINNVQAKYKNEYMYIKKFYK